MKLKTFFVVLLLASCGLMATGLGQQGAATATGTAAADYLCF